jgi:hypothetical protein
LFVQIIENEAIEHHQRDVIAQIVASCNKFSESIASTMHDFSPKGRQEVKDCLHKLGKASELQQLVGTEYKIRAEFDKCTAGIKTAELEEQNRESAEIENTFTTTRISFRNALKEQVC